MIERLYTIPEAAPLLRLSMPAIGTVADVAQYLNISRKTVLNINTRKEWQQGIYIGRGRYNMSRLHECITSPPYRYAVTMREAEYCRDAQT